MKYMALKDFYSKDIASPLIGKKLREIEANGETLYIDSNNFIIDKNGRILGMAYTEMQASGTTWRDM